MKGITMANIGRVTDSGRVEIYGLNETRVIDESISELKEAWQQPLRW